jgi:hypothetical protein
MLLHTLPKEAVKGGDEVLMLLTIVLDVEDDSGNDYAVENNEKALKQALMMTAVSKRIAHHGALFMNTTFLTKFQPPI